MRGEQQHCAKLTADDVRNIREIIAHREKLRKELSAITNKALAEKFDVHERTIDKITNRSTWAHV